MTVRWVIVVTDIRLLDVPKEWVSKRLIKSIPTFGFAASLGVLLHFTSFEMAAKCTARNRNILANCKHIYREMRINKKA